MGNKAPLTQGQLTLELLDVMAGLGGEASTKEVYAVIGDRLGLTREEREQRLECGDEFRAFDRDVRWAKELAKKRGMMETPKRGLWRLTQAGFRMAKNATPGVHITMYELDFGRVVWAMAETAFGYVEDNSVQSIITSPPFALQRPKAYDNVSQDQFVDWFMPIGREMARVIRPDGSIVLNFGHAWEKNHPVQSLYHYRLLIRLCDELGLHLAQEFCWHNPSRLPSPAQWVTVNRLRVKDAFENVFWLSKTPYPKSNQRAVLKEYSEQMKALIRRGGEKAVTRPSGHQIAEGAFAKDNGGAIPPNVLIAANTRSQGAYFKGCREEGLPIQPARFPEEFEFFVKLTTDRHDRVMDPFFGSGTIGEICERLERYWLGCDMHLPYLLGSMFRFPKVAVPDLPQLAFA